MRRPVVPLVRPRHALIRKSVSHRTPRRPAVVRPLNHLSKPPARLRRPHPVRFHRRPLHVVNLPPRKKRPAYVPILPRPIRTQDKRPFLRPHQHPHPAHPTPSNSAPQRYQDPSAQSPRASFSSAPLCDSSPTPPQNTSIFFNRTPPAPSIRPTIAASHATRCKLSRNHNPHPSRCAIIPPSEICETTAVN